MKQPTVRALTISQPWASLIVSGDKFVENRRWPTQYRGTLFIHAGQGTQYLTKLELKAYPTAGIIGVCQLVDCIALKEMRECLGLQKRYGQLTPEEMARISDHEHAEGPFCFVLSRVIPLRKPVRCSGMQQLWMPPEHVTADVMSQIKELEGANVR